MIHRVIRQVLHKRTVDFNVVELQLLQVAERTVAGTEIIKGKLASEVTQRCNLAVDLQRTSHGKTLGDFENNITGDHAVLLERFLHVARQVIVLKGIC